LRPRGIKKDRPAGPPAVRARLSGRVSLEAHAQGEIAACFDGYSIGLGTFGPGAAARAQELRTGLPLASLASGHDDDKEVGLLVRRLARHGLLEYGLGSRNEVDQIVIEPQVADYWPRMSDLNDADVLVLSRFAYLRRRGSEMVLESPRADALVKVCDPKIATAIAVLSTPQQVEQLRRQDSFPGIELLALLVDCRIVFKLDTVGNKELRSAEGDDNLAFWDFHDLLFHARSTEGRHASPTGGIYPYAGIIAPPPAVRAPWPGEKIDLRKLSAGPAEPLSPAAKLLRRRHSTRVFDDQRPITLVELARFLDGAARIQTRGSHKLDLGGEHDPVIEYATRPYPSGGGSWELELYLSVDKCEGLARGFYHYDADAHALVPIAVRTQELDALLSGAQFAMDAPAAPQILITIAARFGRVSWKYSSLAYALILKDAGVLIQTLYLMSTDIGLGACAIGSVDINRFARMTGIEFHIEGPVGQIAIGRSAEAAASG
jgi:SagB-type dehydrogenase family enzyme